MHRRRVPHRILLLLGIIVSSSCGDSPSVTSGPSPVVIVNVAAPESLYVGESFQATAQLTAANGAHPSDRPIAWSSSAAGVVSVSPTGLGTVAGTGTAWIRATSEGVTDSVRIKGQQRVASLTLSPQVISLTSGFTTTLGATLRDAAGGLITGRAITWLSTNPGVVLAGNGGIAAAAPGTALVIATSEGHADTTVVTVTPRPFRVAITPVSPTLAPGDSIQMTATVVDSAGNPLPGIITYFPTPPASPVGKLSATGFFNSYGVGTFTVSAHSPFTGVTGTATITVSPISLTEFNAGSGWGCGIATTTRTVCWPGGASPVYANPNVTGGITSNAMVLAILPFTTRAIARSFGVPCVISVSDGAYCFTSGSASAVMPSVSFAKLARGGSHTCGVSLAGDVWCTGTNANGEAGNGSTTSPGAAGQMAILPAGMTDVQIGDRFSCALAADSTAWCWGFNTVGQVGSGSNAGDILTPVPVAGGRHFAGISAGNTHVCAVTAAAAAWCWGDNRGGQLGAGVLAAGTCNATPQCSAIPVAVAGGLSFVDIAAGASVSCGITAAGAVYCWGVQSSGNRIAPTVGSTTGWSSLSLMSQYACVRGTDGRAYCYDAVNSITPIRVFGQQ